MDIDKIQKINKLAKNLKDSGIVHTRDEAAKMAEQMISKGELPLKEKIVKEELLGEPEEENKEPFILKKPEQESKEFQEEISDIKGE